jgi:AraC-like DNA-binding protein
VAAHRDPIREWREGFARRWLSIDFRPLSDAPFRASVKPIFEDLRIARVVLSPGVTFRDEDLVKDGDNAFSLCISQSKNLNVTHQGRELQLAHGDATLLHVCTTGSVGSREEIRYIAVMIPPPELAARSAHRDNAVMQRLPRRTEALQLLRAYLGALEKGRPGAWREGRETIRQHVIDLAALAITPHGALGESSLSAVVAGRLNAALQHIGEHFDDPELSVAGVARSLGISPRYLQRLIETSGTSFTARVNELRLQRVFTLLTKAGDNAQRISDIALQAGFSDISHFNRLFRSRFGDTPSGVRGARPQGPLATPASLTGDRASRGVPAA